MHFVALRSVLQKGLKACDTWRILHWARQLRHAFANWSRPAQYFFVFFFLLCDGFALSRPSDIPGARSKQPAPFASAVTRHPMRSMRLHVISRWNEATASRLGTPWPALQVLLWLPHGTPAAGAPLGALEERLDPWNASGEARLLALEAREWTSGANPMPSMSQEELADAKEVQAAAEASSLKEVPPNLQFSRP